MFDNYRIPREFLMNRTADVTPEGVYESSFKDPSRLLGAALEMLGAARVGVIQENTCIIGSAVTIAVRYGAVRKQFGVKEDEEMPIIEYPLHVKEPSIQTRNRYLLRIIFSDGVYFRTSPPVA